MRFVIGGLGVTVLTGGEDSTAESRRPQSLEIRRYVI